MSTIKEANHLNWSFTIWDKPHREGNHTDLVNKLIELNKEGKPVKAVQTFA